MSETPITDMVRRLMAAGCSIEVILIAVEGAEGAARIQRIRERDRATARERHDTNH